MKKVRLSNEQAHIIELMQQNHDYFIRQSTSFRHQELTDGKYQGFKYYFNESTLKVLKSRNLLSYHGDFIYKLNV